MQLRLSARSVTTFVFILLLLVPSFALAQTTGGTINGTVSDDAGNALPGVTVTAHSTATGVSRDTVTTETGAFQLPTLPPGTYDVTAELSGMKPVKSSGVVVNIGSTVSLKMKLKLGLEESVTVTAAAPLVETTRTQVSSVVNEKAIENLPTNGRNFIDFVLTTPGVVKDVRQGDISFAGQRGTLNSLVVDGANNDNTFFGQALGRTGSGRAPYQFSQDAVKEFQVNTNAYSAEYGRAGGAVINVVTKSGTNEFHGAAFDFLRDKRFNANDYINEINNRAKGPYHYDQYGVSFGGPIVRDRHFFFTNYDAQRNSIDNIVILGVPAGGYPTDAASQAALAHIQEVGGSYAKEQNQDVFLLKTDHELFANDHLSLRFNRQKFTGVNFENGNSSNSVEHTGDSLVKTDTFSLVNTSVITHSMFNELRGQYAKDSEPGKANSGDPEAQIFQGGVRVLNIGRNTFSPRETTIKRKQIADTLTFVAGNHTMKGGFDVNKDDILNYFPGNFFGSFTFNSLADYANNKPARFIQAFPGEGTSGPTTHPDITEYAGFVQDEWRVLPTLTLNGGLRYDFQGIAQPSVHNPDAQLAAAGIDTSVVPEDHNNFAPRLGFAWTPNASNRTVVRGGYGIFYGRTPAIMIGTAHSNNGINVQTITFDATKGDPMPVYPEIFAAMPSGATLPKPTIVVFDKDFENPKVQQASFGVEQALFNDLSVGVNYQYVKGSDLPRSADINIGESTMVTTPVFDGISGASLGDVTYKKYSSTRPFSHFGRIIEFQSTAHSKYNGLTFDVQKRFANNWQARLAYTYSKVKDDRPDATSVVPGTDDAKNIQDAFDIHGDWGPGDNDVRHRVVLSGVWSLDSYAANLQSAAMKALASGWTISGIASYQSGQPYTALVNADLNNDGNNRNDRAPGLGRNSFNLPSQISVDPRITRDINMFGGTRLQLIAEAFNILNRSNVNGVRTTYYSYDSKNNKLLLQSDPKTGFGTPTLSAGPRIIQLAAKVTF